MNRYKSYMSRLPRNEAVEYSALNLPRGGAQRSRRALGMPRLAAVAAAFMLLLGGGAAAWALAAGWFTVRGPDVPRPPVTPVEEPSSTEALRPGVLESVFVPFTEHSLDTRMFWGRYDRYAISYVQELPPRVFHRYDEFLSFMETNGFQFGFGPNDWAANSWAEDAMDFGRCAVIAVYAEFADTVNLLAPLVTFGDEITVTFRFGDEDPREPESILYKGFFLMIDRELLGDKPVVWGGEAPALRPDIGSVYVSPYRFEDTAFYDDITPENLLDARVSLYKHKTEYQDYLVYGGYGQFAMPLGTAFGGYGIYDMSVTRDGKYLLYLYSFGSGISRSHLGILSLETGLPVYESGAVFFRQLELSPSEMTGVTGDFWLAVAPDLELAYVTVRDGGVLVEILSEEGYVFAGLTPPGAVQTSEPPAEPQAPPDGAWPEDADNVAFHYDTEYTVESKGYRFRLPDEYRGRVLTEYDTGSDASLLLRVTHIASQGETGGFLYRIGRYTSEETAQVPGLFETPAALFARDETYHYVISFPSDVQYVSESYEEYAALRQGALEVCRRFIEDHALTAADSPAEHVKTQNRAEIEAAALWYLRACTDYRYTGQTRDAQPGPVIGNYPFALENVQRISRPYTVAHQLDTLSGDPLSALIEFRRELATPDPDVPMLQKFGTSPEEIVKNLKRWEEHVAVDRYFQALNREGWSPEAYIDSYEADYTVWQVAIRDGLAAAFVREVFTYRTNQSAEATAVTHEYMLSFIQTDTWRIAEITHNNRYLSWGMTQDDFDAEERIREYDERWAAYLGN